MSRQQILFESVVRKAQALESRMLDGDLQAIEDCGHHLDRLGTIISKLKGKDDKPVEGLDKVQHIQGVYNNACVAAYEEGRMHLEELVDRAKYIRVPDKDGKELYPDPLERLADIERSAGPALRLFRAISRDALKPKRII